jgi:hypothetical protein
MSDENPETGEEIPGRPPARPQAPNCLKCAYFEVTWDPHVPRSCVIFGFESYNMPSWEVFRATGKHCPSFRLKEGLKSGA